MAMMAQEQALFPLVQCIDQKHNTKDTVVARLDWSWDGNNKLVGATIAQSNFHVINPHYIVRIRDNGGTSFYKKYDKSSIIIDPTTIDDNANNGTRINSKFQTIYSGKNTMTDVVKYLLIFTVFRIRTYYFQHFFCVLIFFLPILFCLLYFIFFFFCDISGIY